MYITTVYQGLWWWSRSEFDCDMKRNKLVSSNYATQSYLKLFVLIVLKMEIEQIENYTNIQTTV